MEPKDLMKEARGNGEEFALFLDHLKQLSIFMENVVSSTNNGESKEVLEDKLKNLKKHGRKARKMEDNKDVDLFVNLSQLLERTIRLSLLGKNDLDIEDILGKITSSFGNLKKVYGMRGGDMVKSVKLAREIEGNVSQAKEWCYGVLEDISDEKGKDFEIRLLEKLLDIIYELEFLSDHFIVSVDSRIM